MSRTTVAKRIADLLANEGVECFYSLPEVTFGLIQKGVVENGIKMVAPHHETVCGYMAEAHASLTGQFQVAAGAQGPGTMNLMPCIAHSYYERLPVLYIGSGRRPIIHQSPRQPKFQCPNIVDSVRPFTKYSTLLADPLLVDEVFMEAFRQLRIGVTGPVYVEVSNTILGIELDFPPLPDRATYIPPPICPPEGVIQQIADKLAHARLPLVISGSGVRVSRAKAGVSDLLSVLKSPVMCTFKGRYTVPDNHPRLLDMYSPEGDEAWAAADVVLVLGSSIGEKEGFGGRNLQLDQPNMPWGPQSGQYWIHVEKDPYLLGRNRPVNLPVLGDLNEVLPRLTAELRKHGPFREPAPLEGWRQRRIEAFRARCGSFREGKAIHPARLMVELDQCLPEDAILVKGGGAISLWQLEYMRRNFSEMLWAVEMGMLGAEVGYTNACELAKKKGDLRRVVCITGDGSFGFYPMEIETAVRHNLPVLFIVGYDQQWGMEVQYYDIMFGDRQGYETGHAFGRLDKLAEALGAHGELVDKVGDIRGAVRRSLDSGKPSLIQVIIDGEANSYDVTPLYMMKWCADTQVYFPTQTGGSAGGVTVTPEMAERARARYESRIKQDQGT